MAQEQAAPLAATPRPPESMRLREITERADPEKIDEPNLAAFGEKFPGMVDYQVSKVETGTLVVLAGGASSTGSARPRIRIP